MKPRKYRNVPVTVDGVRFDSKREAEMYQGLLLEQKAGKIRDLRRQVRYPLAVNGVLVCTYVADAVYWDNRLAREVVADAKGVRTREYRIKRKLMLAIHNVEILEL